MSITNGWSEMAFCKVKNLFKALRGEEAYTLRVNKKGWCAKEEQ